MRKLRFKVSEPFAGHIPREGQFQGSPLHLEQRVLPPLYHRETTVLPVPTHSHPSPVFDGLQGVCPCTSGFSPTVPKWLHTDWIHEEKLHEFAEQAQCQSKPSKPSDQTTDFLRAFLRMSRSFQKIFPEWVTFPLCLWPHRVQWHLHRNLSINTSGMNGWQRRSALLNL